MIMAKVIFYEKPGCINNTKQKAMLSAAGHQVEPRNLLTTNWTPETLRPFFGSLPIAEWFNPTAPRIKSGEIIPSKLDEATALKLMIAEPILIRRPLIQVDKIFNVGFDQENIKIWIGLNPGDTTSQDLETCPHTM
jgi:nitrogenase-associated protein